MLLIKDRKIRKLNFFFYFLFFTLYFLFSGLISSVNAQDLAQCCLSTTDSNVCRLEEVGKPCDDTVHTEESVGRNCLQEGASGQCLRYETAPIIINQERRVNCSEYAACRKVILGSTDCSKFKNVLECRQNSALCFWFGSCYNRSDVGICNRITDKNYCGTSQGSDVCQWQDDLCLSKVEAGLSSQYTREGGILPKCAYQGNCRSVNDLLQLLITVVREGFKYIGSIAFFFFVLSGVTIVLSFGNPEKVKRGKDMLMAAVIGIIISFGAYVLIDFILDTLQVAGTFKG